MDGRLRKSAEALEGDNKAYIFDLDGQEDLNAETPDDAYSVDSKKCGIFGLCLFYVAYDLTVCVGRKLDAFSQVRV